MPFVWSFALFAREEAPFDLFFWFIFDIQLPSLLFHQTISVSVSHDIEWSRKDGCR